MVFNLVCERSKFAQQQLQRKGEVNELNCAAWLAECRSHACIFTGMMIAVAAIL